MTLSPRLAFGGLTKTIESQLHDLGLTLGEDVSKYQKWADQLHTLYCHQLLSEGEWRRANKRLLKKISKNVKVL
jgi:hypothetical protein